MGFIDVKFILYINYRCLWVYWVYIILEEFKVFFEEVIIDFDIFCILEYLKINLRGLVFVFFYNGEIIIEFVIVVNFLVDVYLFYFLLFFNIFEGVLCCVCVVLFVDVFIFKFNSQLFVFYIVEGEVVRVEIVDKVVVVFVKEVELLFVDVSFYFGGSDKFIQVEVSLVFW